MQTEEEKRKLKGNIMPIKYNQCMKDHTTHNTFLPWVYMYWNLKELTQNYAETSLFDPRSGEDVKIYNMRLVCMTDMTAP